MKTLIYTRCLFLGWIIIGLSSSILAQEPGLAVVDPSTAPSAQAAVQKMGIEMMKGNFQYGHDRMYPRWNRRLAKRSGGTKQLAAALAQSIKQQEKMGMMVTAFHAERPTSFFSVWRAAKRNADGHLLDAQGNILTDARGKPLKNANGKEIIVEHWLAIVPTVTRVKVADPNKGGKIRTLVEQSYTVAISEKGTNDWYFMTGMKPTLQDLRSMFPSLPPKEKDMGLPTPSLKEIK